MNPERRTKPMLKLHRLAIPLVLVGSAACSETAQTATAEPSAPAATAAVAEDRVQGRPVAGLPFSQGRSFATLDDYLAFLKARGAHDVPWYREARPGVYELVTRRRPGTPPQLFTREQLAQKFGFSG